MPLPVSENAAVSVTSLLVHDVGLPEIATVGAVLSILSTTTVCVAMFPAASATLK